MGYSNSPLVAYTRLSPNHSGQRTHSIDRITPHCVVGQLSAGSICDCFASTSRQASCNYGIGSDGRVALCVEEKNRSWCTSSGENDQRAVTIECASDSTHPYAFNSAVYSRLVELCTDICKRNGKKKLLWLGNKEKAFAYEPKPDEMVLTVHRWTSNKSCPGDWMYARMGDLASKVTAALAENTASDAAENTAADTASNTGLQAMELKNLSSEEVIARVGPLFTADQKHSGVLASVSLAQFILESGYGKSELAQNANNCFGMKKSLSGNTWAGSTWDGKNVYSKETKEQHADGSYKTITADFRKYSSVEASIADHSAYLLGAMNGTKKRYEGIAGMTDYKAVAQRIKDGGYATSLSYGQNLCSIIERWNLTKYDAAKAAESENGANAPGTSNPTETNKPTDTNDPADNAASTSLPYRVRVSVSNLNIRRGPGTNYASRGYTGKGVFTIVEEAEGKGASRWGLLKSYKTKRNGWISLDIAKRV